MNLLAKPKPPRWATRLLRWYCAPHLLEEVQGDLEEEFDYQVKRHGLARARWDYLRNVVGFIKPFAIKRKPTPNPTPMFSMNMIKHYTTVAFRQLIRQRAFSAINIVGLALGMTAFLLIYLWVQDEKHVDNFHTNGDRLFSVYTTFHAEQTGGGYATRDTLSEFLEKTVPEIQHVTAYASGYELPWGHPETFQVGEKLHKFEGSRAGEKFFSMFSYPLLAGDAATALKGIKSLAISRKVAEIFFTSPQEALGKTIRFENRIDFVVTAVFEDVSPYSSLRFDFLVNWEAYLKNQVDHASWDTRTYVQLQPGVDPARAATTINRAVAPFADKQQGYSVELGLQRFGDQYLQANFENGRPSGGRIEYVRIFSGVAVFILIIACINFMNLATARAVKRAKEVGVRKVVGSTRRNLISQFFGESLMVSFLALAVGLVLLQLVLPVFNTFTGKQMHSPVTHPTSWIWLLGLAALTGLVAGSYPALFLSSLKPVRILKGMLRFTNGAVWFRKGLAVFQFSLSIILLIATLVVSRQTHYVQSTHLGYDRENLIYIRIEGDMIKKYAVFKEQASKMPGIAMVDRSSEAPHAMGFMVSDAIDWEGKDKKGNIGMNNQASVMYENGQGNTTVNVGFYPTSVGYDFLSLMNLPVVDGRGFSRDRATDKDAFMINEEAVRQMGIKDPIGKWISAWDKKGHIIGILKDFHVHSLHEPISPVIVDVKEDLPFGVIMVRTEAGKTKEALASLEKVYKEVNPNYPFAYQFLDQEYGKLYHNEQVIAKLSNVFAVLAITISCLGLLGLVMFSSQQRVKEIGIRKVLGATVVSIVGLLSKDFLKLVALSFVIAAPIAGYFMNRWLQGFAFQVEFSWWIYALAGGAAFLVAILTISVQALESARTNPVKSLKAE